MAAAFCIPKQLAETLKAAASRGEIDIGKMYEMTSGERRSMFEQYVDKPIAKEINAGFERAMISEQQTALKKWAENTFTGGEKKGARYKDVISKIDNLSEMGVLTPENSDSFLSDLVASKLGATVTSEEAKIISAKAERLQSLSLDKTEFNTPTLEYFKARREMENYLASLTPSSNLRIATETVGRATMLISVKSPLLNIESNTVQGILQAAERRISNASLGGMNSGYAVKLIRFINKVYKESGYDISRMDSLAGRKQLGESVANTQGKGAFRAVGRVYEDVVFNKMLSAPDVAFSSVHFADSANIASSKIAKREKLKGKEARARALEIFKDASSIEPKTIEGIAVREQAKADALYATYTNKSVYSDIGLSIRKIFNIPSKDLRIGDQIMPFVKTPANVIGTGIDASGVLLPADMILRVVSTMKGIARGEGLRDAAGENFRGFSRKVIRAGLGLTAAYLLSTLFKPDDFIGEYPVSNKEKQLLDLKNATTNSVKIGNKWISLDYFGALGAPLVGFLYAKKYGKGLPEQLYRYAQGVGLQSAKIPGFDEFYNTIKALNENRPDKTKGIADLTSTTINNVTDFVRARVIPGIVYDLAKSMDTVERRVDYNNPTDKVKNTIPGLRQQLPEKYNIFGETKTSEGWSTMLFGARVKTASNDPLVSELVRLDDTGNLPSITDVSKTSDRAKELKKQLGEARFDEAMRKFGQNFKHDLGELVRSDEYVHAEGDDERKKMIDSIKSDNFDYILGEYNYQPVEK